MRRLIGLLSFLASVPSSLPGQDGGLDLLDGETLWAGGHQVFLTQSWQARRQVVDGVRYRRHDLRTTAGLNYGLRSSLTLSLMVPYQARSWTDPGGAGQTQDARGVGDVAVIAKLRLYKRDWHLGSFNWTAFLGTEIPTGSSSVVTDAGDPIPIDRQPGSGAWDLLGATAATVEVDRWKLNGSVSTQRRGRTGDDSRPGHVTIAELTLGRRVIVRKFPGPLMRLDIGVRARRESRLVDRGTVRDSDSQAIWLVPALVFWPSPSYGVVGSAELPLKNRLGAEAWSYRSGLSLALSHRF